MEKFQDQLIENLLLQAAYFLKEAGEFYPFGSAIDNNGKVKPVSAYLEGDFPGSEEVIDILKNHFFERLKNKDLVMAGICFEVNTNPDNIDGIQIEIFENSPKENRSLVYAIDCLNNQYSFRLVPA